MCAAERPASRRDEIRGIYTLLLSIIQVGSQALNRLRLESCSELLESHPMACGSEAQFNTISQTTIDIGNDNHQGRDCVEITSVAYDACQLHKLSGQTNSFLSFSTDTTTS